MMETALLNDRNLLYACLLVTGAKGVHLYDYGEAIDEKRFHGRQLFRFDERATAYMLGDARRRGLHTADEMLRAAKHVIGAEKLTREP